MAAGDDRPIQEVVRELEQLGSSVMEGVRAGRSPRDIEDAVLKGLEASAEAVQRLEQMLESGRLSRPDIEPVSGALEAAEQKLAFFQSCTMRRSTAAQLRRDDEAAASCAERAERLAEKVCATRALDQLVEGYKALEGLEAQVAQLREELRSGTGPDPRVLDLPRARVVVARRGIGGAIVALDDEE